MLAVHVSYCKQFKPTLQRAENLELTTGSDSITDYQTYKRQLPKRKSDQNRFHEIYISDTL